MSELQSEGCSTAPGKWEEIDLLKQMTLVESKVINKRQGSVDRPTKRLSDFRMNHKGIRGAYVSGFFGLRVCWSRRTQLARRGCRVLLHPGLLARIHDNAQDGLGVHERTAAKQDLVH